VGAVLQPTHTKKKKMTDLAPLGLIVLIAFVVVGYFCVWLGSYIRRKWRKKS
jgi:hypothetical protein